VCARARAVKLKKFAGNGATLQPLRDEIKAPPQKKQEAPRVEEEEVSSGEESDGEGAPHSTPQVAASPSPAGAASYAASSARASPANASPEVCARRVRVCACAMQMRRYGCTRECMLHVCCVESHVRCRTKRKPSVPPSGELNLCSSSSVEGKARRRRRTPAACAPRSRAAWTSCESGKRVYPPRPSAAPSQVA
jgi:hypothetical protein